MLHSDPMPHPLKEPDGVSNGLAQHFSSRPGRDVSPVAAESR